ncbi:MAG: cobaltochelatase subunit CobN [Alphaproteobacteria bacterium]|nr:cobaltochelatase subunit CobN [Alphaproteobacteria bacterium]
MHLLAATAGAIDDGTQAVDLDQTPGAIVFLSAADSELALLAAAKASLGDTVPTLRLASLLALGHNLSVDLYVEKVVAHARLVIMRLLGGANYWSYGLEQVTEICRRGGIALAVIPGDDQPDDALAGHATLPTKESHRLWQYLVHGGNSNARQFLRYAASLVGRESEWIDPQPILRAGLYWSGIQAPDLAALRGAWGAGRPVAALLFYRALLQAGNLAPIDGLVAALSERGINPMPIFLASLKDPVSAATVRTLFSAVRPDLILNTTGFAANAPGQPFATPFEGVDVPVLQVVFSGGSSAAWVSGTQGLGARDMAMSVALPEVDGRIATRAVSFKVEARFDAATETSIVHYEPVPDRIAFVAELAKNWVALGRTPPAERRVALILANYPMRDGRLGNGVGLDTPASAVNVLGALRSAGYGVADIPADGLGLMQALAAGPTNHLRDRAARSGGEILALDRYAEFFSTLPRAVQDAINARWGAPESDPHVERGEFRLALHRFGNVVVGIQPARGYHIDPTKSYHDPALVPPHGYLAFYAFLRQHLRVHAIVHLGKHGNLEWLPGKAVALSEACYPEAVMGPLPHLYPFIVNDPGEGSQAKRRASAVIIDHLMPPLARAESYGPLRTLEQLADEYYEAAGVDPRRLKVLRDEILALCRSTGLDIDLGLTAGANADLDAQLAQLDTYLCELKELQIRDGLHVFGESPKADLLSALIVALTRLPRNAGAGGDQSLTRALARDLGLDGFDPLSADLGETWVGRRPASLATGAVWRTAGDTVEQLERLALDLVAGRAKPSADWNATSAVLDEIERTVRPALACSGAAEIAGLLAGLDGRFVTPGPSGAPSRGRLDVLPTGRNFYAIDPRTVPTPAAWTLGWKSAGLLLDRYVQEHGAYPKHLALSAWGTANMRTGGDDIAQALALLGVRPTWDSASRRVTGFEILPLSLLDRPRVDVTLRVSGFFRDAFAAQIDLFDSATRAIGSLAEPAAMNPLAAKVGVDATQLERAGMPKDEARRRASYRVFGSKPGAYGAGLQALIDERAWTSDADLARAYVAWSGYAYGGGAHGVAAHDLLTDRLGAVELVVHNQDNREHDLLDSDDYYQFEGGLAVAVKLARGVRPAIYHNDHSRPENPKIRTLEDEIARIVRARVVNPKWIKGVMRHGYKGGAEMAATVDYMFAFAATTGAVRDHHFDAVYDAYFGDADVDSFLQRFNPAARREIAERLIEATERGLWRPRSNTAQPTLAGITERGKVEA